MAKQRRKLFRRRRTLRWKGLTAYGEARSRRSEKAASSRARLVRSGLGVFGAAVGLAAAAACWAGRRAIWSRSGHLRGGAMAAFAACGGGAVVSAALIASNSAAIGVKPIPATAAVVSYASPPRQAVAPPTQSESARSSRAVPADAPEDASKTPALSKSAHATPPIPLPKPKPKSGRLASSDRASGTPGPSGKTNAGTGVLGIVLAPSRVARITVAAPTVRILDRAKRLDPDLRKISVATETPAPPPAPLPRPKPGTGKSSTPEAQPAGRGEDKPGTVADAPISDSPIPTGPITSTLTPAIRPQVRVRIALANNPTDDAPTQQGAKQGARPKRADAGPTAGERPLANTAPTAGPRSGFTDPEPGYDPDSEPSGAETARNMQSLPIDLGRPPDLPALERLAEIAKALNKIETRIEETRRQTRATVKKRAEAVPSLGDAKIVDPETVWTSASAKRNAEKTKATEARAYIPFYEKPFAGFIEPLQSPESGSHAGPNEAAQEPATSGAAAPGPVAAKQPRIRQRRARPIPKPASVVLPAEKPTAAIPLPSGKPRRQPPPSQPRARTASLPPANAPPMLPGALPTWMLNAAPFNAPANRPLIAIVIDDLGLDRKRSDLAVSLPGPLTMSYLTYAPDLKAQVANARRRGHELMLHLPMEPERRTARPGPHALKIAQDEKTIRSNTAWGLGRFKGYVAVNNHMGSKLTASSRHMRAFLSEVGERGLFFLDSMTTHKSVGMRVAREIGVPAIARDVFLDHNPNLAAIENQLTLLELRALRRGFAVAIGHPFDTTVEALRKWLPKAKAKGFEIAPISAVMLRSLRLRQPILAKRGA